MSEIMEILSDNSDEIDEVAEQMLLKSDSNDISSNSDNDSDDSADEEENNLKEYMEILNQISQNTLNYDLYIKLTETAHKINDLDKIRQSYNLFSSIFPLSPELWLKYINIEINLASSPTELKYIETLFRKAMDDYYSPDIGYEFFQFAKKLDDSKEIHLELLNTYGYDTMNGRKFYTLHREYNNASEINIMEKEKIFIQTYLEELKIPHFEMEESYIDFKVYYEKNKEKLLEIDWNKVDKKYQQAKKELLKMMKFENELKLIDSKLYQEKANVYFNYIKDIDEYADENVIQIIYERMITECCLNELCWLKYVDFVEKRDKYEKPEELKSYPLFLQTPLDINAKALRNCTWSYKLYIQKIHIFERLGKPKSVVQEIIEQALKVGFHTSDPIVFIWLDYLSYMRRNTNFNDSAEVDILRKNFELCWNSLGRLFGVLADCNCEILQFWGRLEYTQMNNPAKGKELWNTVMESSDNASKSALWLEFIQLEIKHDLESVRKIYKKALNIAIIDNAYTISSSWIRFERCHGTLKQLVFCQEHCNEILKQYELSFYQSTSKFESKNKFSSKNKFDSKKMDVSNKGTKRKAENPFQHTEKVSENMFKKPKILAENVKNTKPREKTEPFRKEHENEAIDLEKDHLRIFLSNLDYNVTEDEISNSLLEINIKSINLIKASNGRSRGFGYVELLSEDDVQKALKLDRKMLNGRPVYISSVLRDKESRQAFKYSDGIEINKLFVKGIPPDATKNELETVFGPIGKVKDIRIVYHKSGKSKCIAYVEYENDKSAKEAVLKLNDYDIRDHKISVAISAPPPKHTIKPVNASKILGIGFNTQKLHSSQTRRINLFVPSSVMKSSISKEKNGNLNSH